MHRNTDGARLVGNRTGNCLTNPPSGIGRELITTAVFELIDRFHQADVAFLDEIQELQTPVGILLGDRNHQAQVSLNHLFLGTASFRLTNRELAIHLFKVGNRELHHILFEGDLALGTSNIGAQRLKAICVLALRCLEFIQPCFARFITRKRLDKRLTRHLGFFHAQLHDRFLLGTHLLNADTHLTDQALEVLRHQLDRREKHSQAGLLGF